MKQEVENRRDFLGRIAIGTMTVPFLLGCERTSLARLSGESILDKIKKNAITDSDCNWCGAKDVPADVARQTNLTNPREKGEIIEIRGTVFQQDGKTPSPNILIYLYHTDTEGLYGQEGQPHHGRFRGWLLTDKKGQYNFRTIKPASYPNRQHPAHIHMTLTGIDRKEDWIDNILFKGDKLITPEQRIVKKGGFNPILELERSSEGILEGVRDIQLP